jgi:hypothetical protein
VRTSPAVTQKLHTFGDPGLLVPATATYITQSRQSHVHSPTALGRISLDLEID